MTLRDTQKFVYLQSTRILRKLKHSFVKPPKRKEKKIFQVIAVLKEIPFRRDSEVIFQTILKKERLPSNAPGR